MVKCRVSFRLFLRSSLRVDARPRLDFAQFLGKRIFRDLRVMRLALQTIYGRVGHYGLIPAKAEHSVPPNDAGALTL